MTKKNTKKSTTRQLSNDALAQVGGGIPTDWADFIGLRLGIERIVVRNRALKKL